MQTRRVRVSAVSLAGVAAAVQLCGTAAGMDLARRQMRVEQAAQCYGVSGAGVVVAILDRDLNVSLMDAAQMFNAYTGP